MQNEVRTNVDGWLGPQDSLPLLERLEKAMIGPPSLPEHHPERFEDCQQALKAEFEALVNKAVSAGWRRAEVVLTIGDLADNETLLMAKVLELH